MMAMGKAFDRLNQKVYSPAIKLLKKWARSQLYPLAVSYNLSLTLEKLSFYKVDNKILSRYQSEIRGPLGL